MPEDEQNGGAEVEEQVSAKRHLITVILPQSDVKQIQVHATSQETVNDIKQSLGDLASTNHFTCFELEYQGEPLQEMTELGSIEALEDEAEFKLVQTAYNEIAARTHIARALDFLSGGVGHQSVGGETNFAQLQLQKDSPVPLVDEDITSKPSIDVLVSHDNPQIPACLKSLALSSWNPATTQYKARGHLLYLVLNTLEGDSIHITSSVSGFYANNSTAAKFDNTRRAGTKLHHSLVPLLKSLSPLFKRNYTLLEKYIEARDPILTTPIINAHAAQAWIASPKEPTSNPVRVQRPFLEHGFENNDTLRDWNEEIQNARELPVSPLQERIMRCRVLQKTLHDFSVVAAKGAELLVKGELMSLNPTEPADAQMYIYSNIFFSRGLDGVGTFHREGGDAAAHKAGALDANGVRILSTLDVDGLSPLGTCIVDYAGHRIVAQTIVPGIFQQRPEEESQIVYGGVDGRDVIGTDSKCDGIFSKISAALRLRRHAVYEKEGSRKELELSIDTKGLAGADGRTYIMDLYRITPLDIEFLEAECPKANEGEFISIEQSRKDHAKSDKYPHRMTLLRYELMEAYWESKLNEYVQAKLAEEDASKQADGDQIEGTSNATQELEDKPLPAVEAEGGEKEQDAKSPSVNSEEFTEVPTGGEVANNGEAEIGNAEQDDSQKERRVDISGFSLLFNPDVFHIGLAESATEEDVKQRNLDEAVVRDVSKYLREHTIPTFLDDLKEARVATPMDSTSLSKALHKRGINIRYLGKILQLAEADAQCAKHAALVSVLRRDIVARSAKHVLSSVTRDLPFPLVPSAVAHFLNCFFQDSTAPVELDEEIEALYPRHLSFKTLTPQSIKASIELEALRRFRFTLEDAWQADMRNLPALREIAIQFGLQLRARDFFDALATTKGNDAISSTPQSTASTKKNRKSKKETSPAPESVAIRKTMFVPDDILSLIPKVKNSAPRSGLAEEAMEAGRVFIVQGNVDLGRELLAESLSLHEQIYGVPHPETARGYNALALIYSGLDDNARALELAQKAVIVAERTLGLDDSETILYYLNLALFEHKNEHTKQALRYLQHALTQWRIIFGSDHPDMITTINNVAVMLQSLKLYAESLKWFESSIGICEAVYGSESVNAATLYFQVAQGMALTGNHKSSINRMRDSYNIFKKEFGEDNQNTKETHLWLTQLTQSAVNMAKQAKIDAGRKSQKINGQAPKPQILAESRVMQNQRPISTPAKDERIGSKGLESIEELVNYISGEDKKKTTKSKNTTKKAAKR